LVPRTPVDLYRFNDGKNHLDLGDYEKYSQKMPAAPEPCGRCGICPFICPTDGNSRMVYVTLLFLLFAATFGISGMAGMTGMAVAPIHILFFLSMLGLLASLVGSLFPRR
jgi:ferredoxin